MEPAQAAVVGSGHPSDWAVDASRTRVWRDAFCVLHVAVDGEDHAGMRPRRVFPISSRSPCVSFMNDKGEEELLLRDPDRLDPASAAALVTALSRVYCAAQIREVYDITEAMGVSLWGVMTDRGYASFEVVDRERHIRLLPKGRYLITDADGNRFEIPCVFDLDERSQRLVETET